MTPACNINSEHNRDMHADQEGGTWTNSGHPLGAVVQSPMGADKLP